MLGDISNFYFLDLFTVFSSSLYAARSVHINIWANIQRKLLFQQNIYWPIITLCSTYCYHISRTLCVLLVLWKSISYWEKWQWMWYFQCIVCLTWIFQQLNAFPHNISGRNRSKIYSCFTVWLWIRSTMFFLFLLLAAFFYTIEMDFSSKNH